MKRQLSAIGIGLFLSIPSLAMPGFFHKNSNHFFKTVFQKVITGKVNDQNGDPLAGVTVTAKNTTVTAVTDVNGNFSIEIPAGTTRLVFSYVGSEDQEVDVNNTNTVSVQLKPVDNTLSDVVVIGYGSQRKANLTGSVATISGSVLTRR
ncbi:MAG TPA: carboxypeptidase-like regulatory domain-containing protein, partial [Chitinophagaceae bacterium]|nr:carboxypeptidase-like regulatory domain-containing protein [Chitinophagaceae bacterium]